MKRDEIDNLINIYLDGLTDISQDAGWEGDSMIARMMVPSGGGKLNDAMMRAYSIVRLKDPQFGRVETTVITLLRDSSSSHLILAVLSKNYYRGLNKDNRPYTDAERAYRVGQNLKEFRKNLVLGYRILGDIL